MATLFAFKHLLLSFALVLGSCAGGPDELHLGYGHTFVGDSRLGESANGGWPIENDDLDTVTVGLSWHLRPQRVVIENPDVSWNLQPVQEPEPTPPTPEPEPQDPAEAAESEEHGEAEGEESHEELDAVTHAAEHFDALGLASKIILGVLALTSLVVFRRQIGAWIPGTKASAARKADKNGHRE